MNTKEMSFAEWLRRTLVHLDETGELYTKDKNKKARKIKKEKNT